jgi:2-keto-4-pentenoate hydratase/2-oxohepta-3-ene-1,7-dioic acid hydratase in catechol pathway
MSERSEYPEPAGALGVGTAAGAEASAGTGAGAARAQPAQAGAEGAPTAAAEKRLAPLPAVTLLSIQGTGRADTLGIRFDDGVFDVARAAALLGGTVPLTLGQLLREGGWERIEDLVARARTAKLTQAWVQESSIRHGRLLSDPGKILCVGLNYRKHAIEVNMAIPRVPVLFNKFNNALAPHNATIRLPPREVASKFDYETELLVVIGRHARAVPESEALSCVAGYCTANDFSARDLQLETGGQWMIGKTLDGFAPIGPYFVSAAQVGDPNNLTVETHVNGELRQSSSTSDFIFTVQQVIAYVSRHFALEPGDVIFTGTPQGVIQGMPPDQRVWLKAGDRVTSCIEKLGTLSFTLA